MKYLDILLCDSLLLVTTTYRSTVFPEQISFRT